MDRHDSNHDFGLFDLDASLPLGITQVMRYPGHAYTWTKHKLVPYIFSSNGCLQMKCYEQALISDTQLGKGGFTI